MTSLSLFEKGLIVGPGLAGASISKTANLPGVSKGDISKVFKSWNQTHSPFLEGVNAIRAQFYKSVIGVASNELRGRAGMLQKHKSSTMAFTNRHTQRTAEDRNT
ncbi:hypothetical protein TNCV_1634131 [Trichonephila clavipes]|nr:hypothetical protein TNCV_1634131 [Trichonephila clavipes]